MIIGFAGKKGSGKSAATQHLLELHDNLFDYSFAAPLKMLVGDIYDLTYDQLYNEDFKEVVDERWGKSPRQLLQEVGVHLRQYDPHFWVHPLETMDGENVVIDDVRFPNEVAAIKEQGGIVIYIDRPGEHTDQHESENAIGPDDCTHVVKNSGSLNDLLYTVEGIVQEYV